MKKYAVNGSAIITALFIMTLVAIIATAMSLRLQLDISRTTLIEQHAKMKALSQKVPLWAMKLLSQNALKANKHDELIDHLPKHFPGSTEAQISVSGHLYDMQALFNLNNLHTQSKIKPFALLLHNNVKKLTQEKALDISRNVYEWVNMLNLNKGHTELDKYYEKHHYYQAHTLMVSPSEFRLIKGVNQKVYEAMAPLITALPKTTPVNINTAPLMILRTLGPGLTTEQAKKIIKLRTEKKISNMSQFLQEKEIKPLHLNEKNITLQSRFFLAVAQVQSGSQSMTVYSVLFRKINKKRVITNIIQQTVNTL